MRAAYSLAPAPTAALPCSIAVDDGGAMYTWGWGAYAQLMHGDRK